MSAIDLRNRLGGKMQGMHHMQYTQRLQAPAMGIGGLGHVPASEFNANPSINPNPSTSSSANLSNADTEDSKSNVVESGASYNDHDVTESMSTSIPKGSIASMQSTTIQSNYIALSTNTFDIINENLKNQPLSPALFDIIKAPTGGFTAFNVPGINGDEVEKELVGIILDYTTPRAYWETPEPIEGTPPVCYSLDSVVSVEGKACSTCLYNTFGSKGLNGATGSKDGDSNAKACKESIQLFLLRPDSIIPIIVRIPVTSKIIFQKYMTRLVSRMIPLSGVVTKITLEKATSNGGQPYAKFSFEAVEMLSSEESAYARAYGQKFSEMLGSSFDAYEEHDAYGYQNAQSSRSAGISQDVQDYKSYQNPQVGQEG